MDFIDLTSSSPATHARRPVNARARGQAMPSPRARNLPSRPQTFAPREVQRPPPPYRPQATSRPHLPGPETMYRQPVPLAQPQPQPSRQLRSRAVAASSAASTSLGTTPSTTTPSSTHNSPALFITTDSGTENDSEEFDSMEEYLQANEAYLSSDGSSIGSGDTGEEDDSDDDDDEDEEEEDEDDEEEEVPAPPPPSRRGGLSRRTQQDAVPEANAGRGPQPIAPALSRTRSQATNNVGVPESSRAAAAPQESFRPHSGTTPQPHAPPASLKRPRSEATMPTAADSSPASKKAKIEPVEVVDMVNVEDEDDFKKIMQEQMIKTQREEGNARRRIADFKCVICLDDPENLSATTCGHLFCNDCIKTTLRFGQPSAKFGKCPVCRGKVVIKEIVPLELKLIKRVEGKGKGKA
ncbi:SUMO-targeted ubiquitin ligase complex subunit slx8 [Orbilia javanica]|uniref:SUMO-targeted ubiquitin ligase complex subunit slx8 n=1 Tax=Orbilia javanica TaxID=47235 RepID=A0AAN8RKR7_9PEZI